MISAEYLRSRLDYDPETGVFTWRAKPEITRFDKMVNTRLAGLPAGTLHPEGYVVIVIDGRQHKAHRLAWLYVRDEWPVGLLDHRDRNRANNRIANLRAADRSQNNWNSSLRRDNKTGIKGVSHHPSGGYVAMIQVRGVPKYLGYFQSEHDAKSVYDAAAEKHFGEFATEGVSA